MALAGGDARPNPNPNPTPNPNPNPKQVAKRLQALGAITKGDRRAADASDLSAFDVDTKWGQRALNKLLAQVSSGTAEHEPPEEHVRQALELRLSSLRQGWAPA